MLCTSYCSAHHAAHWHSIGLYCVLWQQVKPPSLHFCKQLQADHRSQSTAPADALSDFRLDGAMHSTPPSDPTSPEGRSFRAGDSAAAPDTGSTVVWGDLEVSISPADSPVTHAQTDLRQHASRVGDDLHELRPSPDLLQLSSPASVDQMGGEETCATMHGRSLQHDGGADLTPVHYVANVQWQSMAGASPIDLVTPSSGVASTVATPTFSESGDLVDLTQT